MKKPRTISQRAVKYAQGKRGSGPSDWASKVRETSHAEGWEDGYRAAMRDVKQVGTALADDLQSGLERAIRMTLDLAAKEFTEELGKIE